MTTFSRALTSVMPAALLLAVATPALAQTPAPATPGAAAAPRGGHDRGGMHHRGMFATLSEPGRATMREAMKGDVAARQADRAAVKAARDRMLTVLEAERLDMAALKKAMADERNAANASRERMQASMAAGFAKLSVADRRAFVAEAKAMRARMDERMKGWKGRRGGGDDMPEPPMMF
jgi:Spy/CpxP family protein refolding chaperone